MQEETRACDQVRVRSRQPRGEHDAEVHVGPYQQGGGRRDRSARAVGAGTDGLHAGAGERVDAQVAQGGEHQDQGLTRGTRGGRTMPEVYNWQLGRKMLYPYEERHPKWQFTFVFNINRCIACQTCSMADKSTWLFSKGQEYMWWNNVETKPYGGEPPFFDVKGGPLVEEGDPGGAVGYNPGGRQQPASSRGGVGVTLFNPPGQSGGAGVGAIPTR